MEGLRSLKNVAVMNDEQFNELRGEWLWQNIMKDWQGTHIAKEWTKYKDTNCWVSRQGEVICGGIELPQQMDSVGCYVKTNDGIKRRVDKMVIETFKPIPNLKESSSFDFFVVHIDGNRYNNHIDNLIWLTHDQYKACRRDSHEFWLRCRNEAVEGDVLKINQRGVRAFIRRQLECENYSGVN